VAAMYSSSAMNSFLPKKIDELVHLLQLIPHPEGGYFREIYRSGSVPMESRGLTDQSTATFKNRSMVQVVTNNATKCSNSHSDVTSIERKNDDVIARNALTSIYWVPTIASPKLLLAVNLSDHVHYYQGGGYAFLYYIFQPTTATLRTVILGPNLSFGHELQVPVVSGEWKCGHLVSLDTNLDSSSSIIYANRITIPSASSTSDDTIETICPEYAIIGEAVGPGFDIHDFRWITAADINGSNSSLDIRKILHDFVHPDVNIISVKDEEFDKHYSHN
jgi:uncharacterized protein